VSDERSRLRLIVAGLLLALTLAGLMDLKLDAPEPGLSFHLFFEISFILLGLGGAVYLAWGWFAAQRSLSRVQESLSLRQAERDAWSQRARDLLAGLGRAIDVQLDAWQLTPMEKETALFLLKGYSHKEIAELCGKSERTVRQQAVAVYRKSGLAGRAELSAFFLEDLLLPLENKAASLAPENSAASGA
jgi:DNA-binding CsgD family transcriptional regulator